MRLDPVALAARREGRGADPEDGPGLRRQPAARGRGARAAPERRLDRRRGCSTCLKGVAETHGLKLGDAMQPIRVALTGSTVSEPVNELLEVVGPRAQPGAAPRGRAAGERRAAPPRDPPVGLALGARWSLGGLRQGAACPPTPVPLPTAASSAAPPSPPPPLRRRRAAAARRDCSLRSRLAFVGDINLGTLTHARRRAAGQRARAARRRAAGADRRPGRRQLRGRAGRQRHDLQVRPQGQARHPRRHRAAEARAAADERRARKPPPRRRPATCYAFLTPTALAPRLVEARVHPPQSRQQPRQRFRRRRAGDDRAASSTPSASGTYGPLGSIAVDTVRRGDSLTTVGLIGFTTYPYAYDLLDIARSAAVVDSVRPLVDLLVVTFHGGAEGVAGAARARGRRVAGPGAAGRPAGLGPRGDRRRRRRGRRPRPARAPRDRVLPREADRVLAGQFSDLPRLQPRRAAGPHRRAAARARPRPRAAAAARFVPMVQLPRQRARAGLRRAPRSSWSGRSRARISATPPRGSTTTARSCRPSDRVAYLPRASDRSTDSA